MPLPDTSPLSSVGADPRDSSDAPPPTAAPTVVEMWTDGACKGNPGVGGWGVWMRAGGHERELFGGELVTTNNRMELTAVIEGLRALTRPCAVTLNVDSQYVMKGMGSWLAGWKRNGWRTADKKPVKNVDLWQALDAEVGRHTVQWVWVKGHAGDVGNEKADALANRGVDQARLRQE
jgi:ribonuclease HI